MLAKFGIIVADTFLHDGMLTFHNWNAIIAPARAVYYVKSVRLKFLQNHGGKLECVFFLDFEGNIVVFSSQPNAKLAKSDRCTIYPE